MFKIQFTILAQKQFDRLPEEIKKRVVNSLERIKIRPYAYVKKLVGNTNWSLRVGKYRVIINIDNKILTILVLEMGLRKNIYSSI